MRAPLVALLLAGCAAQCPPLASPPVVPIALRDCPVTAPAPVPPRTRDAVVAWGNANAARADVCRDRLRRVVGLVGR